MCDPYCSLRAEDTVTGGHVWKLLRVYLYRSPSGAEQKIKVAKLLLNFIKRLGFWFKTNKKVVEEDLYLELTSLFYPLKNSFLFSYV